MCDPKTNAELSLTTEATGALVSALGVISNARNEKRANQLNAAHAKKRADDALTRGDEALRRHGIAAAQFKGRQRANLAASGVVLTEGSPMEILASTDYLAALDAQAIRENAQREAEGYDQEAANYGAAASASSPFLTATGGLLTSASKVADRWSVYKSKGINPFGG